MTTTDASALQQSDLNKFLFADIGTESNGMTLSVVSLFARLGGDPWQEAGRLAELPKPEATARLARAIADLPTGPWQLPDAAVIAARLTGLLPTRPARREHGAAGFLHRGRPSIQTAVAAVCVALAIGYVIAATTMTAPPRFDGGDVASFATPASQ